MIRSFPKLRRWLMATLIATSPAPGAWGAEVSVAVASNFRFAMQDLARVFETATGHRLVLSFGSTGKHYAQIRNGAPFDVFLAADQGSPARLEKAGLTEPGSRFTYAIGRLVLWSPRPDYVDSDGRVLFHGEFHHLAIANPRLAPYGRAAEQVLTSLGLLEDLSGRIVRGENVAQAYQFVTSGTADLGFLAQSQVIRPGGADTGSRWIVPADLYQPIEQQAVMLESGAGAAALLAFLRGEAGRRIIRSFGYSTP